MFARLPPITKILLIANIVMFFLQQLMGDWLLAYFALWPLGSPRLLATASGMPLEIGFQAWQLISYAFLHGNLMHLTFNMLALVMFGGPVEQTLGKRAYLGYYFACVVGAALSQLMVTYLTANEFYPTLGASGGVFGLLLAFAMFYPQAQIMLLFPPIPLPAWLFAIGYAVIELYLGVTGTAAGVAHFAHLGGMAIGFLLIQYWRGRLPIQPKRRLMR